MGWFGHRRLRVLIETEAAATRNLIREEIGDVEALVVGLRRELLAQGGTIMATAAEVLAAVQGESTVVDSVLALLQSIQRDPSTLDAVVAQITADKAKMEAAILAGTPQAP